MKADEVHKLSDEEIVVEAARLRKSLYELKSQAVTEKIDDPSQLKKLRQDVARLMTEASARKHGAKQDKSGRAPKKGKRSAPRKASRSAAKSKARPARKPRTKAAKAKKVKA